MKFNFRKIASVLASAVMIGSTAGMALAANYPSPFVTDGEATGAIVVGANAPLDVAAATSLQADLNALVTSVGTEVTLGEEAFLIVASGDDLNYEQSLSDMGTLKKDDLPLLLADGTVEDDSGDEAGEEYDYDQEITLSGDSVTYKALDDEDYVANMDKADAEIPLLVVDQSADEAWNLTIDFDDALNASALDDSETITMAGVEFTFDPDATSTDPLTLYSSTETITIAVGESQTVSTTEGMVTISVDSADVDNQRANIVVDGDMSAVEEGEDISVGDTDLYIKEIFTATVPEETAVVEMFVGADKIEITADGSWNDVEVDGSALDGMTAKVTGDVDAITQIDIAFTPSDLESDTSEQDSLEIGESIVDPLFGTIAMVFESVDPELMSDKKDYVELSRAGSSLEVAFTNVDGEEYAIEPYEGNGSDVNLGDDWFSLNTGDKYDELTDEKIIILTEGDDITKVLQVKAIDDGTDNEVTFRDLSTGEDFNVDGGDEILDTGKYVCEANVTTDLAGDSFDIYSSATCVADMYNVSVENVLFTESGGNITLAENDTTVDLIIREDATDLDETDVSASTIQVTLSSDGDDDMKIGTLALGTGNSENDNDDDVEYGLTSFGSYVELEKENEGSYCKVWMPEEENDYMVYVTGEVSVSETADGVQVVTDDEVSSVSDKNLIVVGGSCVNSVAAAVLGVAEGTCGEAFTAATGVGLDQYLIKAVESPYNAAKTAVLVAGYEAADTANAAAKLQEGEATDVGTEVIGPALA
ncbi:MAG: hypothetical protein PVG65_01625 [Candidatus Thorarchaeota archaeon]